jgi:hypothetical protein
MLGSWQTWEIPDLSDLNGTITSPPSNQYNCLAWAAGVNHQWWWPDRAAVARRLAYWPPNIPIELTFDAFFRAYGTLGYQQCFDGAAEAGYEKIAIYGRPDFVGTMRPTHAATSRWSLDQ